MRILITGSKGFIGSRLVNHLANHEITELDKRLEDDIEPYFKNQDMVIHLAAKQSKHTSEEIYRVNVQGTEKVARLSLKYGCKLINISSICMHDDSPYGRSKAQAEKIVEEYANEGLKAITVRPCGITRRKYLPWLIDANWYPVENLIHYIATLIEDPFDHYRVIEIKGRGNWGQPLKKKLHRLIRKLKHLKSHE
ncbi:MAG: SDR family oxidoreductase [Candidatus Staskawiczbacteria bacterium]|nr:SDR family oxidoreductase [Candidatus Staskawiczbacteria bacterium]